MSDELRREDREVLEALNAMRNDSSARDVARRRTREAFLRAGTSSHRTPAPRRRGAAWMAIAAVLAVAIGLGWYGSRPDELWRVLNVTGPVDVVLDGAVTDLALGRTLDGGHFVLGDSTEVELEWGNLHLRLRPGTDVVVPHAPGRWFDRTRVLQLTVGEAFGSSGTAGAGFDLHLQTEGARARLLGTTFAVIRTDDATCFCLFRGGLEVTPRGGESFVLPVQRRVFIYDDGRPPSIEPLDAGEVMKLQWVDEAASED